MKEKLKQSFLLNLGIVLILCTLLYIAFFTTLNCVTRHGQEVLIPDVRGKGVNVAMAQIKDAHFEISVDSAYEPDLAPLSILKQVPDSGSVVKQGRTVFLTVNMVNPPRIAMPALVNLSFRSAEMLLHNNKLKLGDTSSKPDIAAGAVLEQTWKGQPIKPGDMIPQGSKINLVIGDGMGNTTMNVPDVVNLSVEEAELMITQNNLRYNLVLFDPQEEIADTFSAMVMDQYPAALNATGAHNVVKAGDIIDLKIK